MVETGETTTYYMFLVGTGGPGSYIVIIEIVWLWYPTDPPVASGGQDIGNLYAVDAQDKDAPEVCYGTGSTGRFCPRLPHTSSHFFWVGQIKIEIHMFI